MSKWFCRASLSAVAVCAAFVVVSVAAQAQGQAASADARLRALYTEEWTWRQQEMGGGGSSDAFPRVDAGSQQRRLAYWTKALATLDTIPLAELSPDERVNAQVFRASVRALADDVRFRTYETPFNSDTFF